MNTQAIGGDFDDEIDLRDLFRRIADRRWVVIGSVALFLAVFCVASFLMQPIYRATTVLVPAMAGRDSSALGLDSGPLGGLAAAAGISLGPRNTDTEEALAVLRSREFTENFIVSRHLMRKLFSSKWSIEAGEWKDVAHPPTLAKAYKYFDRKVRKITEDKRTGLITLQIEWSNRSEAADWANDLVSTLNAEMRARAIKKADASIRFLENELQSTSAVEVRSAIGRLMEAQVQQRMLADVTPDYSFRVVDRAIASDGEEPVWPQKALISALGAITGLVIGSACAILLTRNDVARRG